jgi:integrase
MLVEPKSERSRRVIVMPEIVKSAIRAQRMGQREQRLLAGSGWRETGFIFTSRTGTPLDPWGVIKAFKRLLQAAGLPNIRFHDLRHTAATFLLAQGVDPRTIMETLGHSQISLTLNTYSHVLPSLQRDAAEKMNRLLVG